MSLPRRLFLRLLALCGFVPFYSSPASVTRQVSSGKYYIETLAPDFSSTPLCLPSTCITGMDEWQDVVQWKRLDLRECSREEASAFKAEFPAFRVNGEVRLAPIEVQYNLPVRLKNLERHLEIRRRLAGLTSRPLPLP